MTCHRCGEHTPRLTIRQTRCPRCQREVEQLVAKSSRPRRFPAMDLTGWIRWSAA